MDTHCSSPADQTGRPHKPKAKAASIHDEDVPVAMMKTLNSNNLPLLAKELIAGGLAGGLAKTCMAPLERVKILFQTGQMRGSGIVGTMVRIAKIEGFTGLFRGNFAGVLRMVPYAAIHYGAYENYRLQLVRLGGDAALSKDRTVSPLIDLLAGAAAGASAVIATYPLDFVRTRLAYKIDARPLGSTAAHATISGILRNTVQKEGMVGLYRGIGPTLMGILPYAGLKFYVYQALKQEYMKREKAAKRANNLPTPGSSEIMPIPIMLLFGAGAGLVAQTATYPLDLVRRQMQVQGLRGHTAAASTLLAYKTTLGGLICICKQQGWRSLYAGLSINYLKVVPSTAVGFAMYDCLKSNLGLPNNL